jgi:NTP pyrophosphatase (non-canonical NTP hydrolase)
MKYTSYLVVEDDAGNIYSKHALKEGEVFVDGLTISALQKASMKRIPHFRNAQGQLAHSKEDGSDWSLAEWLNSVLGELGEAANELKKFRRGDHPSQEHFQVRFGCELADVLCYLVITAAQADIDLETYVKLKWNEVSARIGYDDRM